MLSNGNIFFAGQMTGVEGYIESAASGFAAGVSAARKARGEGAFYFPDTTMIGAMARYVRDGGAAEFQPMNANFGIMPPPDRKIKGGRKMRYSYYAERALAEIDRLVADGPVK
jgi:methylenetetrahydrofolate--tRNA-(uracil-5-)-methyltransferase